MTSPILAWEAAGAFVISILGSLLHFVFELLGGWPPAALIAAVNESTWEHLKLAFWPALCYALLERRFLRPLPANFWAAKAAGILAMPLVIVGGFYGYTALAGGNVLWADISLFVVAVFAGQILSARLMKRAPFGRSTRRAALGLLILLTAAFSLATYFPPRAFLFQDPRSGKYGILK